MRPSFYIKKYTTESAPETLTLYSTKTSALILIPFETYRAMQNGTLCAEDEALLKELGFLVPDQKAEIDYIINKFDRIQIPYVQVILTLNMDCNFACRYCFEGDTKTGVRMGKRVLEQSLRFIEDEIKKQDTKELLLGLYGGEPLLTPDLTKQVLFEASKICARNSIKLRTTMVTNGSLLKRDLLKELIQFGLQKIRVTIDGPPEVHNYFRPFKNKKGSFEIILKNLKECIDLIQRLEIGGNYSKETYREFPRLLDILLKEGLTPEKVEFIRFEPIINQPKGISIFKGGCSSINEPWVAEAGLFLREEIIKRGYKTRKIEPIFCMVNNKRAFIIGTDGGIYKCPGFIGIEQFKIGDVFSGVGRPDAYSPGIWKNEKCASCVYLPLCYGGCRYMAYLRHGTVKALDCQKTFFDKNLHRFIEQELRFKKIGQEL